MKLGDCYEANGRYLFNFKMGPLIKNYKLVHGIAILVTDGKPFGHCWIEKGNTVFDFSNGNSVMLNKKDYYRLGKIPVKGFKNWKYSFDEMLKKINKYGHWGPWDSNPPR